MRIAGKPISRRVFVATSIAIEKCSCCGGLHLLMFDEADEVRAIAPLEPGLLARAEAEADAGVTAHGSRPH